MLDDEEELPPPEPPDTARIARRAFVLAGVACRSAMESNAAYPRADTLRREVLAWLAVAGALSETEPGERRLLEAPLGGLSEREEIDASWRGEGLAVLAWTLGRYELPGYDQMVEPSEVAKFLGFLEPAGLDLVATVVRRPTEEIETLADRLLALHWRLRQFSREPVHMDFQAFARTAYFGPLDVTGLAFARGDLAIDSRPLIDVPESRWRECMSIARERQQAANWLCGQEVLYSDVTCDT